VHVQFVALPVHVLVLLVLFGFFPHVELILCGLSPGLCRVSTDLNQLLHVIVGFGPQVYSVCRVSFLYAFYKLP